MSKTSASPCSTRRRAALLALSVSGAAGFCDHSVWGLTRTWLGDGTKSYETTTNWSGGVVPSAADDALFDMGGFLGFSGSHTVTFASARSISSISILRDNATFSLGGTTYTLASTSPLSLLITDNPSIINSNFARLTLQSGTLASAGGAWLGQNSGDTGTLLVSTGGVGTFAGEALVGNGGSGSLIIQNGGDFFANQCTVGSGSPADGNVLVTGSGSSFHTTGANGCVIGEFGSGTVTLSNFASATTNGVAIGSALFGTRGAGTITISRISTWTNTGSFIVGAGGTGTLVMNSGTLNSTTGMVGADAGAEGFASLSAGAKWINSGNLTIGSMGDGTVLVGGGGILSAGDVIVGDSAGSTGILAVSGTGSFTSSSTFVIGNLSDGTFSILAGGKASTGSTAVVGNTWRGTALIDGTTSAWTAGGELFLAAGSGGSVGSLSITNGGSLSSVGAHVGAAVGSSASVLISGAGAAWTCSGSFDLGGLSGAAGGAANLTIATAATLQVTAPNTLRIYTPGALHLNGGTLSVGSLLIDPGGVFDFSAGTLAILGTGGLRLGTTGPLGAIFDATAGRSLVAGTLNLDAGAILRMSGGTVSATTLNNSGEIVLGDPLSTLTASVINNNGLIDGDGVIAAPLQNNAGGEIRADAGKRVLFTGPAFSSVNDGQINLFGGAVEFNQQLTNNPAGRITGRGTIIGHAGLANAGSISLSGGLSDVNATLSNQSGSKVIITGGSTSTFFQAVTNQSGSEFRVSTNSTAVFLGNVTGLGQFTGPGVKDFEASASAGPLATTGSSIIGPSATLSATTIREAIVTLEGTAIVQPNGTPSATSRINNLTIDGVSGVWTGRLDLSDNDLIIDYSGVSPLATVAAQIRSGFNSGLWNGNGISSSLAGGGKALGYGNNATLGLASFSGQSVDNTSLLIKYTYAGDANLDGQVDISDLGALATNWQTGSLWTGGDFNYDGFVDISDLGMLATNWQLGVGSPLRPSFDEALSSIGLSGVSVPEPSAIALLAGAASLRRRPRSRKSDRDSRERHFPKL